jgi:hypothetical protein
MWDIKEEFNRDGNCEKKSKWNFGSKKLNKLKNSIKSTNRLDQVENRLLVVEHETDELEHSDNNEKIKTTWTEHGRHLEHQ